MRPISQMLLTLLLNACWQSVLIAAIASACSWLLRKASARYRHFLWVAVLGIAFGLPLLTYSQFLNRALAFAATRQVTARQTTNLTSLDGALRSSESSAVDAPAGPNDPQQFIRVNGSLGLGLLAVYLIFLLYRSVRLVRAWRRTQAIEAGAHLVELSDHRRAIIDRCRTALGVKHFSVLCSATVAVPITVGIRNPLVILPEALLGEADEDVLTSAVGHELVHVLRRDYLLNLIYELLYLPLSFHPAAALIRRRINQTRELSCDELVTERLLAASVYAHSLVRLAGSAVPFGRHATLTVGITDADILEVRIMSLLRRTKLNVRRKKLLLIAVSLLLAAPCVAAASFGLRFDIQPQDAVLGALQESGSGASQQKDTKATPIYRTEPAYTEDARANKIEGTVMLSASIDPQGQAQDVLVTKPLYPSLDESAVHALRNWRFEPALKDGQPSSKRVSVELVFNLRDWEQDQEKDVRKREKQEAEEQATQEEKEMKDRAERDPQFRAELEARSRHQQQEREAMNKMQVELARLAKLPIEQAIQIAVSQQPGKVLECRLVGEHWQGEGQLATPALVLYHVVILPSEGTVTTNVTGRDGQTYTVNTGPVHVLINAIDGSVFRTSKEERRREPNNK
jgi:TonB family protein